MDYTVCGILQARILEWVAFPFSRGSSQPREWTQVSHIAGGFLSHQGSPRILEWVAYPFFNGSSQPRNWTGVPCIAGRFFTNWMMRETLFKRWQWQYQAGYAAITLSDVLRHHLYLWLSAQWAKFYIPTWSCTLAKDTTANIYTDSWFASGLAHDFGMLWKHVFLTSSRNKVKMVLMFRNYWIYYFTYHFSNY